MKTRVAINGFGRIGRLSFRNLLEDERVEVVAINDLTDINMLAHLLKYDTAQGRFPYTVEVEDNNTFIIDGKSIEVFAQPNPAELPWGEMNVDVVLECTGVFLTSDKASLHLEAGAKKVILSAPAKSADIKTVVLGVNHDELNANDNIVSNASCTTNCLAPMAKVIHDNFEITNGYITTVHAYTADQRLQDAPHKKDMRRARAAAASIIPTSTGAAKAVGKVIPALNGVLDGMAMRVPVITGSITDCNFILNKAASAEEINAAIKKASENELKGILEYTEDPIVSSDIIGNQYSCIFDSGLTSTNGNMLKMAGWYDNEAGYAKRSAELVAMVGQFIHASASV